MTLLDDWKLLCYGHFQDLRNAWCIDVRINIVYFCGVSGGARMTRKSNSRVFSASTCHNGRNFRLTWCTIGATILALKSRTRVGGIFIILTKYISFIVISWIEMPFEKLQWLYIFKYKWWILSCVYLEDFVSC